MKVSKVGEVPGVGDGDGVVLRGEEMDKCGRCAGALAAQGGDGLGRSGEGVEGEAVEEVGEAGAIGVEGGETRIGAVAAGDAVTELGDASLFPGLLGEVGEVRGLVEVGGGGVVERERAEIDPAGEGWRGMGAAGRGGRGGGGTLAGVGEALGGRVLADQVAGDADGGVDLAHGPAGEAVEATPVLAEDELAEGVGEFGGEECGAVLVALVDLGEHGLGEAGSCGELLHHGGEQHGLRGHGRGRRGVAGSAGAAGQSGGEGAGGGAEQEPAGFGRGDGGRGAHVYL